MRNSLLILIIILIISCNQKQRVISDEQIKKQENVFVDTAVIILETNEKVKAKSSETICAELLKEAVLYKDSLRIINLIDSGCSINSINTYHENSHFSPLYWAVKSRELEIVKLLLNLGADPNSNLKTTASPFHLSTIGADRKEIFFELIQHNPIINTYNGALFCETPINCAIQFGNIDIAKKLIQSGASLDPDSLHRYLPPPLYEAARNENWEFFEFLLKSGANPNAKFSLSNSGDCWPCPEGITILHVISGEKNDSVAIAAIKTLLSYGADINITDNEGYNPLEHNAARANPQVIEFLIKNGSDIKEGINNASNFQNYEVVKILLENGANPNQPSVYYNPLQGTLNCCGDGANESPVKPRLKVAKLLLEYGAIPKDSIQMRFLNESFEKFINE